MLEKVLNYIKEHPSCQVLDIVDALENASMLHVLEATRKLIENGFVNYTWTTEKDSNNEVMLLSVAKEMIAMNKERPKEIVNEYLARNNGDAQAAYDDLTSFLHSPLPVEAEEFIYHCEARMILKEKFQS